MARSNYQRGWGRQGYTGHGPVRSGEVWRDGVRRGQARRHYHAGRGVVDHGSLGLREAGQGGIIDRAGSLPGKAR